MYVFIDLKIQKKCLSRKKNPEFLNSIPEFTFKLQESSLTKELPLNKKSQLWISIFHAERLVYCTATFWFVQLFLAQLDVIQLFLSSVSVMNYVSFSSKATHLFNECASYLNWITVLCSKLLKKPVQYVAFSRKSYLWPLD